MAEYDGNYPLEKLKEYEEDYVNYIKEIRGIDLKYYGNWQRDFGTLVLQMSDILSTPDNQPETILDVGCATALNLRAIDELKIFKRIYGTDISTYMINTMIPDMIQEANTLKGFTWNAEDVDFYATPAWDLSMIDTDSVDLLLCTHVLEHLSDEEKLDLTLQEFHRVLKANGKILIIIPTITKTHDPSDSVLHELNYEAKWWSRFFNKYFKSESLQARKIYKDSDLRPDRNAEGTFYDVYNHVWTVFRLVHK